MKFALLFMLILIITGCNQIDAAEKYSLFETNKGVIYRLDKISGESEIIYSPTGWPLLITKALYKGENDKTFQYLGNGELKELTITEAADIIIEKHTK